MTIELFEKVKEEPTTFDMLKWIIKEAKDAGIDKRTMINMVKEIYIKTN